MLRKARALLSQNLEKTDTCGCRFSNGVFCWTWHMAEDTIQLETIDPSLRTGNDILCALPVVCMLLVATTLKERVGHMGMEKGNKTKG